MAKMTLNFVSEALYRAIPMDIIIPTDHMVLADQPLPEKNAPYKTVYYLEGLLGNFSGPANYTRLQAFAEDYNVVVVVVGGENQWYTDSPYTGNYFTKLIARDLVNFTRRFLNLSHKREDTAIMGFSMGGHGAMNIGLQYPDVFGKIIAVDAAWHRQVWIDAPEVPTWDLHTKRQYMTMLGVDKMEDFIGGQHDMNALAEKTIKGDVVPQILIICGTEDAPQFEPAKEVCAYLKGVGYDAEFVPVEGGGPSNWTIDHAVEIAFDWFNKEDNFRQNLIYAGKNADLNADNFSIWKTMYNVEAGDTSEYRFIASREF